MPGKRIMITGANGQLGQTFKSLAAAYPDFEFIFFDRNDLDISKANSIQKIFAEGTFFACINCAAYTAVDKAESEKELATEINSIAVGHLALACFKNKVRFIHFSTDYVFDGEASRPYQPTDKTDPVNFYGETKLKGEQKAFANNPDTLIIRTSWVYSPYGKNFVKTMLMLISSRDEIKVVNDQLGAPTYAADLADAAMKILQQDKWKGGVYHYSNSGLISWYEFAVAIRDISGLTCNILPIPTSAFPTPAKRPTYSALNSSSLQHDFTITIPEWKTSLVICLYILGNAKNL